MPFVTKRRNKSVKIKNRKIMGLQILEGFKSKRKYNETAQDLENHLCLSCREVEKVVPLTERFNFISKN